MAKLALVHHCGTIGGAGVSLECLASMTRERHDTVVYCPERPPAMAEWLTSLGHRVKTYPPPLGAIPEYSGGPRPLGRTYLRSAFAALVGRSAWRKRLEAERADLIAVNSMTLSWLGSPIRDLGARSVCFVRETARRSLLGLPSMLIAHQLRSHFDGVLFISARDMAEYGMSTPRPSSLGSRTGQPKVVGLVRDCVSLEAYERGVPGRLEARQLLGLPPDRFLFLFCGGISELKGTHVALESLPHLRRRDSTLVVAGYADGFLDGSARGGARRARALGRGADYEARIEALLRRPEIGSRVRFLGARTDMPIVYRACDAVVFPSTRPHQARPVFEAGAASLPIVISDFPATAEYVSDGVNGLTFPAGDSRRLAEAIDRLQSDPELMRRLAAENRLRAIRGHSYAAVRHVLLEHLDRILTS